MTHLHSHVTISPSQAVYDGVVAPAPNDRALKRAEFRHRLIHGGRRRRRQPHEPLTGRPTKPRAKKLSGFRRREMCLDLAFHVRRRAEAKLFQAILRPSIRLLTSATLSVSVESKVGGSGPA